LLFLGGATLLLLDALLYSFQTIAQTRMTLKTPKTPWTQHLLLLLVFVNLAMYILSLFAFLGAYLAGPEPKAARLLLLLNLFASFVQTFSVFFLTPADWQKTIPRVLGATLIATGLALGGHL
jgi:hypothetical protein